MNGGKMKGLKKYMAGILVAGMGLGKAAVSAPGFAAGAEGGQGDKGGDGGITLDDAAKNGGKQREGNAREGWG